jgi:hypothetical protein
VLVSAFQAGSLQAQQSSPPDLIGRWDITVVTTEGATYPSWLEIRRSGNSALIGQFVGQAGSSRPISRIDSSPDSVHFSIPPQWESGTNDLQFHGRLADDRLAGWMTDASGSRQSWTAVRAPTLRRAAAPQWGTPIPLFNGRDLTGWQPVGADPSAWVVVGGVLTNTKAGANLVTRERYTDFKLHVEFRFASGGNSGIYLRGRHEVQVEDSQEPEPSPVGLGAVYGFLTPSENAGKKAGEWQAFDITLVGRRVTIVLNGRQIICDQGIPGITGGAMDSDEGAPGPLLLQGDHGPVEYRNLVLTPAR